MPKTAQTLLWLAVPPIVKALELPYSDAFFAQASRELPFSDCVQLRVAVALPFADNSIAKGYAGLPYGLGVFVHTQTEFPFSMAMPTVQAQWTLPYGEPVRQQIALNYSDAPVQQAVSLYYDCRLAVAMSLGYADTVRQSSSTALPYANGYPCSVRFALGYALLGNACSAQMSLPYNLEPLPLGNNAPDLSLTL